mmetsp:Transcript_178095/g.570824  ORF Transcript_178095/g.570824 Transcript_178095/m.570824 type:complete len:444 (+) Transcript_178095:45-1376(+)|eukprot:CAMPEP_0203902866 /NCGR_PEP_ID=MMETSP0359-20131031/44874_1 /ASSEMBLY_ACC=CAM_ASM_000338 /TAXON_ID=268821 /ORGANISM="Scrippsiella Hangoei, Strain SHTV-5" /LENGTH=443 /DNA_ID=CAMNT_0050826799 /DNA_START=15 /DNA_END=1346 /DNA_ORIENTATION=-
MACANALRRVVAVLLCAAHVRLVASTECPTAVPNTGSLLRRNILWTETGLADVMRNYWMYVPTSYMPGVPMPLVFVFHGWGENGKDYHDCCWGGPAQREGFIAVYPQGLADGYELYTSWNGVGSSNSSAAKMSCDPAVVGTSGACHTSCKIRKGACHSCDWTTCYDDVAFISHLLDALKTELCIDDERVFAYGCSNGGLFVHELAQSLGHRIAAVAAGCGGKPHLGWENGLVPGRDPVSMVLFWGNSDTTIPDHAPVTLAEKRGWDGWLYADRIDVMELYKQHNGCTNSGTRLRFPQYASQNLVCTERGYDCNGGTSVLDCEFDGGHDTTSDEFQIAWLFFIEHPKEQATSTTTVATSTSAPALTTTVERPSTNSTSSPPSEGADGIGSVATANSNTSIEGGAIAEKKSVATPKDAKMSLSMAAHIVPAGFFFVLLGVLVALL